jgi:hypothetical protein
VYFVRALHTIIYKLFPFLILAIFFLSLTFYSALIPIPIHTSLGTIFAFIPYYHYSAIQPTSKVCLTHSLSPLNTSFHDTTCASLILLQHFKVVNSILFTTFSYIFLFLFFFIITHFFALFSSSLHNFLPFSYHHYSAIRSTRSRRVSGWTKRTDETTGEKCVIVL